MLKFFAAICFFMLCQGISLAQVKNKNATEAAYKLIKRLLPEHISAFNIEQIDAVDGQDVYEIDKNGDKIVLRGNNPVSIAVALNNYLKNTCNAHFSWCGDQLRLPAKLPLPANKTSVTIPQRHRVYFNYCTISYSAAWWDWERWQREIDFMALNGINMPLSVVGLEGVWYNTLLKYGFTDAEIRSFLVGPAFQAWQWMTNIESHPNGMLPKKWIDSHIALGKKIIERELELGMHPIQQGFSGYVPRVLAGKFPKAAIQVKEKWCGFPGAAQLDPADPLFTKFGRDFLEEQRKLFGLHHYYAADPFHEGAPPDTSRAYLHKVGQTIKDMLHQTDKDYIWVMQSWSIRKDIVSVLPKKKLLVLDLNGGRSANGDFFWGYDFVAGNLHNFGNRINMHGDLSLLASNVFKKAQVRAPNAVGTGLFMEGIIQNPVYYDLAFEVGISNDTINMDTWLARYARRRYGAPSAAAADAWNILWRTAYKKGTNGVEKSSIICARPAVDVKKSGPNDGFLVPYDNRELFNALLLFLKDSSMLSGSDPYRYDMVDILRQCLSNYGQKLHKKAAQAFKDRDQAAFAGHSSRFLQLLLDVDDLVYTREEFRFQKWINDAAAWATTDAERKYYITNASMLVTLWGPEENNGTPRIYDYSWREWSGLIKDYYYQRWKMFYDMLAGHLENGSDYSETGLPMEFGREAFRANSFYSKLADFELEWIYKDKKYPREKSGNEMEMVKKLIAKYGTGIE